MQGYPLLLVYVIAISWLGAAALAIGINLALDDEGVDREEVTTVVRQQLDEYTTSRDRLGVGSQPSSSAEKAVIARILLIMAAHQLVLPQAFKEAYFTNVSQSDYDTCLSFLVGGQMSIEHGTAGFAACDRAVNQAQLAP